MRHKFLTALIAFFMFATIEAQACEIELPDLKQVARQAFDECERQPWPLKMAINYIILDMQALIYDIFTTLKNTNMIPLTKYELIQQSYKTLCPQEFEYLIEERFDPYSGLGSHPFAGTSSPEFQKLVLQNFMITHGEELMALAAEVRDLTPEKAQPFAINTLEKVASKATFLQILNLWDSRAFVSKSDENCSMQ